MPQPPSFLFSCKSRPLQAARGMLHLLLLLKTKGLKIEQPKKETGKKKKKEKAEKVAEVQNGVVITPATGVEWSSTAQRITFTAVHSSGLNDNHRLSRSSILFPYYLHCCISLLLLRYTKFLLHFFVASTSCTCAKRLLYAGVLLTSPVNGFPVMPAGVSIAPE